jgi:hypothetical protein
MLSEHLNLTIVSFPLTVCKLQRNEFVSHLSKLENLQIDPTGMYCPSSCRKGECWSYKGFNTPLLVLTSLGQRQGKKKEKKLLQISCRSIPFCLNTSPTMAGKIHWVRCSPTTLKKNFRRVLFPPPCAHSGSLVVLWGICNPRSWHNQITHQLIIAYFSVSHIDRMVILSG